MDQRVERNLSLIPRHEVLASMSPWIAILVLFTRAKFGLEGAIRLAGLHYLVVVLFEVPSGWMSDRLGRVITLRVAAGCWIVAFTCLLFSGSSFFVVALGISFIAIGYASLSGTDVTLHYDTLEALGRESEYPDRQASISSRGRIAAAVAALVGGLLGLIDLRLAFAVSLVLSMVQLYITFQFTEPPRRAGAVAERFDQQIGRCLTYLREGPIAWIFGYGIAMVVLEHVAFTLLQPWLTEAFDRTADELGTIPLLSGVTIAVTSLVGSAFARASTPLARRFGVRVVLVGLGVLSAVIVSAMWLSTSLIVLVFIAFRSAQGAAAPVLVSTAAARVVAPEHRATFLSLDSLGGRLTYGALLQVVAASVSDDTARGLGQLSLISWALVAILVVTAAVTFRRHGSDPALV